MATIAACCSRHFLELHALAILGLTVVALYLFTHPKIPLESSSLLVLVAVTHGFAIFPYTSPQGETLHAVDFFRGFGHEALVAVAALMVAGQSLVRTGAPNPSAVDWHACGASARNCLCC